MTQQPFSRPGAIDLSGLNAPAARPADPSAGGQVLSAYAVTVDEQNFQPLLESSMTAPVLLVFFSPAGMPASAQLALDLETLSAEFEGRFVAALVDVDRNPAIAQAMQIPTVPLVVMVVDGRPVPLLQDVVPIDELRTALTQILQQLAVQGVTGRHQPRNTAGAGDEDDIPALDPRYAPAQDALAAGDIDRAVEEYQKLVNANPADAEAVAGLAMAGVLQRTQGVDLQTARAAGAANPDDVAAQTLVADLDLLGGHVEDAFRRLIETVRRTAGDDRDQARQHLIGLFAAVGNEDPRVLTARRNLASALF
ncbi:MAG: tetratricopeptide repeat protein [Nocardioides sp.]|jgi:putative thioredoxin